MARVLITGATSGLGLELAKGFHAQGADLVLVGRKPLTELAATMPELFHADNYCQADLAQPAAALQVCDFIAQHDIHRLDVVIHNAGVGYYGDVREQSTDSIKTLLEVNLHAPLALTHGLLEPLKAAQGRLVFISSIAADIPTPDYAVYSASKAALDGLARNLSVEFQGFPRVQVIHPGATLTAIHHKSGVPQNVDTRHFADPEHVAQEIIRAIYEDRFDVTIGRGNRLLRILGKHFGGVLEVGMRWRKRRQARQQPDPDTSDSSETPEPLARAVAQVSHHLPQATNEHEAKIDPKRTDPERTHTADNSDNSNRDNGADNDDQDTNTLTKQRADADISVDSASSEAPQDTPQKTKQQDSSERSSS